MTLEERCDLLPPWACRILAKTRDANGRERMKTDAELMAATGWGKTHLRRVYQAKSFANVSVRDVDKFMAACGIQWGNRRRHRWLLKRALRNGMSGLKAIRHLRCAELWQGKQLQVHLQRIERLLRENPS